ncbi:hypothetical protein BURKHO8Y_240230 [Burkholderia sp. 8Y]|nr:hypothetical protein BURKHO8Y_240230 [Burkholderia sp. 8Y]
MTPVRRPHEIAADCTCSHGLASARRDAPSRATSCSDSRNGGASTRTGSGKTIGASSNFWLFVIFREDSSGGPRSGQEPSLKDTG